MAKVVHDCAQRWSIPLRRGAASGCAVTRAGVVDHATLGSCGGGHFDIGKFRAVDIDKTIRNAAGPSAPPITDRQRARCHELNTIRRRAARTGKWEPKGRATAIRAAEKAHHLRCRLAKHPHLVRRD